MFSNTELLTACRTIVGLDIAVRKCISINCFIIGNMFNSSKLTKEWHCFEAFYKANNRMQRQIYWLWEPKMEAIEDFLFAILKY